jgi:hypothetical protein
VEPLSGVIYVSNSPYSHELSSYVTLKTNKIYQSFIYSPTDALVSCLKNNIKIYTKICIKTAPTCFGAVTPSSGSVLIRAY